MYDFMLNVMKDWTPFGKGFFLLCVFGGLCGVVNFGFHYAAVWLHGWPPEHVVQAEKEAAK